MSPITIIAIGQLDPHGQEWHGSFPEMFERQIGAEDCSIGFDVVSIPDGEPLPCSLSLSYVVFARRVAAYALAAFVGDKPCARAF
jgi:hypothetical protein